MGSSGSTCRPVDDQSKERWKPREVLFGNAVQMSPTWRARTAFGLFRVYEAFGRARVKAASRVGMGMALRIETN